MCSWFFGVCSCKIGKMLCQHCKNLGSKSLDSPLIYRVGVQQDQSLKARLQKAQQNHVYGCSLFLQLETPDLVTMKVGWTSAPLRSLARHTKWASCRLWPFSGYWRPLPGRAGRALAQARNEAWVLQTVKAGTLASSTVLSGNCTQSCECIERIFVSHLWKCLCTQQATNSEISILRLVLIRALVTLSLILSSFFFLPVWQPPLRTLTSPIRRGHLGQIF